jgi:hypothetical protein
MSIHQQVNHYTVDPSKLPDYKTAQTVMYKVSHLLWDLDNREKYTTFHDYWENSTSIKGIRTSRVRHKNTPEALALLPQIHELLAPYEGMYKTYLYGKFFMQGDTGYDVHHGQNLCIVLYYRSWQPGDPREIRQCEPGHELTLPAGSRMLYHDWAWQDGNSARVWVPATIVRRVTYSQPHPYYKIRLDEPHHPDSTYLPTAFPSDLKPITN